MTDEDNKSEAPLDSASPQPAASVAMPEAPAAETPPIESITSVPTGLEPVPANDPAFNSYDGSAPLNDKPENISWTASEFIAHEKSTNWYVGLGLVGFAVSVLIFAATRDKVSIAVIIIGTILLGIYGARQPRQLEYQVSRGGISIGQKHYRYDEFRSFSVTTEGAFSAVVFMPLKRFGLPTTIYYPPDEEAKIIGILENQLPMDSEPYHDAIDNLMRRLRF